MDLLADGIRTRRGQRTQSESPSLLCWSLHHTDNPSWNSPADSKTTELDSLGWGRGLGRGEPVGLEQGAGEKAAVLAGKHPEAAVIEEKPDWCPWEPAADGQASGKKSNWEPQWWPDGSGLWTEGLVTEDTGQETDAPISNFQIRKGGGLILKDAAPGSAVKADHPQAALCLQSRLALNHVLHPWERPAAKSP